MLGTKTIKTVFGLLMAATVCTNAGCDLLGGGLTPLPFGRITAVQLFGEPDFTVALSVESAVVDPSAIARVRWVFGDGGGFVEGDAARATISHLYAATGDYDVTAFLFDGSGFVDQITTRISVAPSGNGPGPNPNPTPDPDALPGKISGAIPTDEAEDVDVDSDLSWVSGVNTDSHDVYLHTVKAVVEVADTTSPIFLGNQSENTYNSGTPLTPKTQYFWRIDEVNALGATKGDVRSFTTADVPKAAKSPVPAHLSTTARVDHQILRWVAGDRATSHDVYFGKVKADVTAADNDTTDIFQGNQAATSFDPEDDTAIIAGELLANTMYFWRIDEVGLGGTTPGTVWEFRTSALPPAITLPVPADGAVNVNVSQVLSWTAAPEVESFDVYFGTDPIDVDDATHDNPEFRGNRPGTSFAPGPIVGLTTYYWRIDTRGAGGTSHGAVRSFTTTPPPAQTAGPFFPADDATNVDIEPILEWNVGVGGTTTSFSIYLHTDSNAVISGSAAALRATQDVAFTTLDMQPIETLAPDTDYFWRVDATGPGGTTAGEVLEFRTGSEPEAVVNPMPANGARGVSINVQLQWPAAVGSTYYDVYFGDSRSVVQNADEEDAERIGQTAGLTFSPGLLVGKTQYFWRIDSNGPGGNTVSDVWSFTTAPDQATAPTPIDGDTAIGIEPTLSWTAGNGAVTHNVYLGDVEVDVETATTATAGIFKLNQTATSYDADPLDGAKTYYWRIDEVGSHGTTQGIVWSFTTGAGQAALPIVPTNGATGVALSPTLTWNAGDGAVEHDVYLGTSQSAVQNATTGSPEFQTTLLLGTESFAPGAPLEANTFYYWRIDEVTADDIVTQGAVWQFRTRTGKATNPTPPHGELGVDVNVDLVWDAAAGATSYDVYLGTSFAAVDTATTATAGIFRDNITATHYEPNVLAAATTHYWRIDAVGPGGTTKGTIWEFTTGAAQATDPAPANGAGGVSLTTTLDWLPDLVNATEHDIYFGTTFSAVDRAEPGDAEHMGTFPLAPPPPYSPGPLNGMTFYFWRIDSVTVDGVTKGKVWSFRTGPAKAANPAPANFAVDVLVDANLTWTAGTGAVMQDVYFGTSLANVTNATIGTPLGVYLGTVPGAIIDPGTLTGDTTYYWRVDSVAADGTTRSKGDVWRFDTETLPPGQATGPLPADGAAAVALPTQLAWDVIADADSYDVYLGTSASAVATADRADIQFMGNRVSVIYFPGGLTPSTVYYWRIDTLNAGGTTAGEVWTFTTAP